MSRCSLKPTANSKTKEKEEMSTQPTQAVVKQEERFTEFVPFGAQDKVKLSIAMVKNLIAVKTKSGKTCSDTDAIKFIAMCQARRLNPFEGDSFLIGYDNRDGTATFSLITAHQAFLKRAELNAEYDGMKSGVIVERDGQVIDLEGDFYMEDDKVLGGWATVHFKNRKQPMHKRIRLQRFKKSYGIWLEDAAGMIVKCAEADALRSSFPTMLGGLYLREEIQPQSEVKTSTPIFSAPAKEIEATVTPAPSKSHVDQVRELCVKDGVKEADLVEFSNAIGICDDDAKTIEDIDNKNVEALPMVIENWGEFSNRIKNTPEP